MANRLAAETSPYLLQHAHNPVDWYPWGEEAFAAARSADRPILLSIGYSACHWCHVMERESFEDEQIAQLMNQNFVCIKVDREERPDVDQLYQGTVALMGKSGGWPLTVFLTPDLRPFFGGTYFPPEDRYGVPGFPRVLASLSQAWRTKRAELEDSAGEFERGLQVLGTHGLGAAVTELQPLDVARAGERLAQDIDPIHGGFGGAPKFPNPDDLMAMLRAHRRGGREVLPAVLFTLDAMARGGVYDQLGGGFHRYSVDAAWQVPHFEKMLYDNAQLIRLYAEAFQLAHRPDFRRVVEQSIGWLQREMLSPEGGFFSSQDADSEGEEGRYFVWTPEEITSVVGDEAGALLCQHLGVDAQGNFEHGRTVLSLAATAEQIAQRLGRNPDDVAKEIEKARAKLLATREKRPHPARDDKILAGWNGLMIGALAKASRAFERNDWAQLAARAADFVLGRMLENGYLRRSFKDGVVRVDGLLEDYGDLCEGLVELYSATFKPRYLEAAAALADRALDEFWDPSAAAFRAGPKTGEKLVADVFAVHDNAWPSGASTLCNGLVALAGLTSRSRYLELANEYVSRLRESMLSNPFAFGHLWCAADALLDGAALLVVAGEEEGVRPLLAEVGRRYAPTLAVAWTPPSSPPPELLRETLLGKAAVSGHATTYLCRNMTCEAPRPGVLELGELAAQEPG